MRLSPFIAGLLLCLCLPFSVLGAEPDAAGMEYFEKHIRPVLVERCYQCHSAGAKKLKGELRLDSRDGVLKGGKDGAVLVAGEPGKSRLLTALRFTDADLQMPPKHQLPAEQVDAFERWIKMGAPDPRTQAPAASATAAAPAPYDYEAARKFWSFQPLSNPPVPQAGDKSWPLTAVDGFVAREYESHHLKPVAITEKRALLRRATYDLTGLPPTVDETEAFLADGSSEAFAKVVDRLLASPAYGEKWGRHWLDLARYADTSGCNSDYPIPQAYKYRNWVIDAFNRDLPYDQFLTEQLAGDLLPAKDAAEHNEHVIATGYLAIARRFGSRNSDFYLTIEDTIDNVGKSMLGLSINCARCHDHKFDPIPTNDYYALYGIFASTKYAFPGTEIYQHPKDFTPLGTEAQARELHEYEVKLEVLDQKYEDLLRERNTLASREKAKKPAATRPATLATAQPTTRPVRTSAQVALEMAGVKAEQRRLAQSPPKVDKAYAVSEGTPHDVRIQRKGNPQDLGDVAPRGFLTVLGGEKLPPSCKGSGRLELAHWIANPKNPLTARVMVNRIWQHHFGVGLVKTPNDFGIRGQAPTNAALLDYLAGRFIASGWSVKSMHRLIMLSRAYQMASSDDANDNTIDPNNDYLWRQNPRRLSAEEIRDTILFVAGSLDRTPGGAQPFPPASEWKYTQHRPFVDDYPTNKRSIYLMQQRIRKQPFLAVFDGADTNAATPDRPLSTTAIQALFMMNDPLLHEQADKLAVRVGLAFGDDAGRIDYAFRLCLGRHAAPEEIQSGQKYLRAVAGKLSDAGILWDQRNRQALDSYMRVLMGSDEFVFVD
ncbi:MAG TPA: PSD1 and planctomycete cytochrome C domain-containing protein [Tepidisphaeraceae bacterium]|nr:PSD1 and planctomycete cytochrome C domain-containing protein [Tepidisphaeraceae bacterium]